MGMYQHHKTRQAEALSPIQNRPYRARNVLALSSSNSPESIDLGRSQPFFDDLIWWLAEDQIGERIMLFSGDGVEEWLESVNIRKFKKMVDPDGTVWYVRVRRNGKLDRGRWRFGRYQMLGYSKDQYALIRWALFMFDRGWHREEIYHIVDLFWTVHKGQVPLDEMKVYSWHTFRSTMAYKGIQWP